MREKLKPCPFCGSAARWAASDLANDFEIQCQSEQCRVWIICGGKTEREAVDAWNTREDVRPAPALYVWAVAAALILLYIAEHGAQR